MKLSFELFENMNDTERYPPICHKIKMIVMIVYTSQQHFNEISS